MSSPRRGAVEVARIPSIRFRQGYAYLVFGDLVAFHTPCGVEKTMLRDSVKLQEEG